MTAADAPGRQRLRISNQDPPCPSCDVPVGKRSCRDRHQDRQPGRRLDVIQQIQCPEVLYILVGLKRLSLAKQRLMPDLSPDERQALMLGMLGVTVTQALASGLGIVALVTSEPSGPALAGELGVSVVSDAGLPWNEGLVHALQSLAPPASGVLYLAGDLPLVTADDLCRFADEAPRTGLAVARARDGGSNALLIRPAQAIVPMFGSQSSSVAHQRQAQQRGVHCRVIDIPGLALDVDTIADAWDAGLIARPVTGRGRAQGRE